MWSQYSIADLSAWIDIGYIPSSPRSAKLTACLFTPNRAFANLIWTFTGNIDRYFDSKSTLLFTIVSLLEGSTISPDINFYLRSRLKSKQLISVLCNGHTSSYYFFYFQNMYISSTCSTTTSWFDDFAFTIFIFSLLDSQGRARDL